MPRPIYRDILGGVDTLEVNAKGPLLEGVTDFLDSMQGLAIEERDALRLRRLRKDVKLETGWQIAGQPLLITPYGVRQGMYQWSLTCPAVNIDMGLGHFNDISAEMRLSSSFLWEFGYRQAWQQVRDLMDDFGDFTYQVSEIHLCADVAGMRVAHLRPQDFVTRGHITRWHQEDALVMELATRQAKGDDRPMTELNTRYGQLEAIRFSPRAAMSGIVYDKVREIRFHSPEKLWFTDLWRKNGWDGVSPVARTEMRPERAVLREMGIETPEQAFDCLDSIWAYSTQQWIRHVVPDPKDKNRSRWPTSASWKAVQKTTFERQHAEPAQRDKVRAFKERQMLGALVGYLESWGAWKYKSDDQVPDMSMVLRDLVDQAHDHYLERESDYTHEVIQKRRKFGFASETREQRGKTMGDDTVFRQVTADWQAQGYAPDQIELWIMLCGYLFMQGGEHYIGWLPKVLYPLLLDMPQTLVVRRWFDERHALPIEIRQYGRVVLQPDWQERFQRMRELELAARESQDYQTFGYLPWYGERDFVEGN